MYGKITSLHHAHQIMGDPPEDLGPAVEIMTQPDLKYRCVPSSTLKKSASAKAEKALARKRASSAIAINKSKKK